MKEPPAQERKRTVFLRVSRNVDVNLEQKKMLHLYKIELKTLFHSELIG